MGTSCFVKSCARVVSGGMRGASRAISSWCYWAGSEVRVNRMSWNALTLLPYVVDAQRS